MIETILWLALNVYWEARNQPIEGQEAIVHVTLNRMEEKGKTAKEIITQRHQFSWYWDGKPDFPKDQEAFDQAIDVVVEVAKDRAKTQYRMWGVNHYHATYVDPHWASDMQRVITIGDHIFYRD